MESCFSNQLNKWGSTLINCKKKMKKLTLSAIIIFICSFLSCGLSEAQNEFSLGFKGGFGVSGLHGNAYGANRLKLHLGLLSGYTINNHLQLQTGLQFAGKGYSTDFIKPNAHMDLVYLDMIMNLKYFPSRCFFIGGGIYSGILLGSQYRYLAYGSDYYGEPDISEMINNFDYGLSGNLGFQFDNGIGMEFSVLYGLNDVFNSHSGDTLVGYYGNPYVIPKQAIGKNLVISTSFYFLFGKKNI